MVTFHTIVTHKNPHLHFDEPFAIWLLRNFGEQVFPGINTAKIKSWGTGGKSPDGRSALEYEREGILPVGIGHGRFDEHPSVNGKRKEHECAATLIAKALGLIDEPALQELFEFALSSDCKPNGHPFDIANLAKASHQGPLSPEEIMDWVMKGIQIKYDQQFRFFDAVRKEFEENAKIEEIQGPKRILTMVSIVSNKSQINNFARSAQGVKADIVIQQQPSGNTQIFTNARSGLILYDVAQMINLAEQEADGKIKITKWEILSAEGMIPDGRWFFLQKGQMLLNGSITAPEVPPTKISFEKIKEIVRIGVDPQRFEPKRKEYCKSGTCRANMRNRCPWYKFGLNRCRKLRLKRYQNRTF